MNHPLKRAERLDDDFSEIDDVADAQSHQARSNPPIRPRSRQSFRPEEPATLARRYGARYEPVRAGNFDDFENEFDPPPYEWGSTSLRHRLRDGEDYRPVRRGAERGYGRRRDDSDRDGFFGRLSLRQSFILAGLGAVIAGGSIGLAATQIGIKAKDGAVASELAAGQDPTIAAVALASPGDPAVSAKLIHTASLNVSDVSGSLDEMIPLRLAVLPATAGQNLGFRISGLPDAAYLTAGQRIAKNWILQPGQEKNLNLVVPQAEASQYQLEVAALEPTTGQLATPAKVMTLSLNNISEAASTPADLAMAKTLELPAAIPAPTEKTDAASPAVELIRKGDILLKAGDLAAARQFYQEAFDQGALEGAIGAAKSYDPAVYAELNVQGLEPDPVKALAWYKKAGSAGGTGTIEAVARLSATP